MLLLPHLPQTPQTPQAPQAPQPIPSQSHLLPPAPPVFGCVCAPAAWHMAGVALSSVISEQTKKEMEGAAGDPSQCKAQPSPKPFFPFSDVVHFPIPHSPSSSLSFSFFLSFSSSFFSRSPNAPTNKRLQKPSFVCLPTSHRPLLLPLKDGWLRFGGRSVRHSCCLFFCLAFFFDRQDGDAPLSPPRVLDLACSPDNPFSDRSGRRSCCSLASSSRPDDDSPPGDTGACHHHHYHYQSLAHKAPTIELSLPSRPPTPTHPLFLPFFVLSPSPDSNALALRNLDQTAPR